MSQPDLSSLPIGIPDVLPPLPPYDTTVPHAPKRVPNLNATERKQAIKNALRYFDTKHHAILAKEFADELDTYGHIYVYRLRPTEYEIRSYPFALYPAKILHARVIIHMIMNVLNPAVAMYPHELVTYGGNGTVFSNWAQYRLAMKYLCEMDESQTFALYSGHPHGVFPSSPEAPRLVVTNGMMVPNYSSREQYERLYGLGVTQYGQMTAGSFCYIGPQGIVHGTTIVVKNAGRKYLGLDDLGGKVFVTSGLGGMSGAQAKAGVICGAVALIAECDPDALYKRHKQGWLKEAFEDLDKCIARVKEARANKISTSIGYLGNACELFERLASEEEMLVELGSDQTSCHNPYGGGYWPAQVPFAQAKKLLSDDPAKFKELVQDTLRRHVAAINKLAARGMKFWDYGNAFLLEASRAGADLSKPNARDINDFRYPSYVQDIMGDVFSLGFGPYRWVCSSGDHTDLMKTDKIAAEVLAELKTSASPLAQPQYADNIMWITQAEENKLVVGSEARILYADARGRIELARRMNEAIRSGDIKGPIMLSRDHHDVSGTDSPFRETADIYDGSVLCADMSVQNAIGDSFRGATVIALHNGGGAGWGEVTNGGFSLVLDGTEEARVRSANMLHWDVLNGVTRRSWAGNSNAKDTIVRAMEANPSLKVTVPTDVDDTLVSGL